jgi:hypothetical protein
MTVGIIVLVMEDIELERDIEAARAEDAAEQAALEAFRAMCSDDAEDEASS